MPLALHIFRCIFINSLFFSAPTFYCFLFFLLVTYTQLSYQKLLNRKEISDAPATSSVRNGSLFTNVMGCSGPWILGVSPSAA